MDKYLTIPSSDIFQGDKIREVIESIYTMLEGASSVHFPCVVNWAEGLSASAGGAEKRPALQQVFCSDSCVAQFINQHILNISVRILIFPSGKTKSTGADEYVVYVVYDGLAFSGG